VVRPPYGCADGGGYPWGEPRYGDGGEVGGAEYGCGEYGYGCGEYGWAAGGWACRPPDGGTCFAGGGA
jgi:hypothetical protein